MLDKNGQNQPVDFFLSVTPPNGTKTSSFRATVSYTLDTALQALLVPHRRLDVLVHAAFGIGQTLLSECIMAFLLIGKQATPAHLRSVSQEPAR